VQLTPLGERAALWFDVWLDVVLEGNVIRCPAAEVAQIPRITSRISLAQPRRTVSVLLPLPSQ
jgi:hypothetical protein